MTFDWRATLVLPDDVSILETAMLDPDSRERLGEATEAYVIHRPGTRDAAKAIDEDAARLLQAFRRPQRIVQAVLNLARATDTPAEAILEECFPLLERMIDAGLLAVAGSTAAQALVPVLQPGARLGRWRIEQCVRLIDDSEVYRARNGKRIAAIKRLRPRGVTHRLDRLLAREAEVLSLLAGTVAPALYEARSDDELPWIALEWREGTLLSQLPAGRDLVAIAVAIAEAYARVHEVGVLHGDVHPGNVLVDEQDRVSLLDFALARVPEHPTLDAIFRGAAAGYWEPEFATAVLRGGKQKGLTAQGEQYAVGTLLDTLIAGEPALRLPAAAEAQWHTIVNGDRRCFAERGRKPWPSVEAVLRRAMARDPEARYEDMRAFARAMRTAASQPAAIVAQGSDPIRALLDEVLPGGSLFDHGVTVAPRASFNFGAAGIAFALYRVARAREDPDLFAAAELWQQRAEAALDAEDGFYDVNEFRAQDVGKVSPYHSASGVWLTRALLAAATADAEGVDRAIRRYVRCVSTPDCEELDLTLGRSSILLGAALLYAIRPAPKLLELGNRLSAQIWPALAAQPPIAEGQEIGYLGIAHGWAGYVYAALAWSRATATPVDGCVVERLEQLYALADRARGALRVSVVLPGHPLGRGMIKWMDGWCHGQAGHVFVQLLAARVLGAPHYVDAARAFGESAFAGEEDFGNLCCGLAGRAYAMLALHRATGESRWLERARLLSARAASGTVCDRWPNSLYKGRVGLAVIAAEIERPELAAMPLFEDEGWL